jgi:hypothetical protein
MMVSLRITTNVEIRRRVMTRVFRALLESEPAVEAVVGVDEVAGEDGAAEVVVSVISFLTSESTVCFIPRFHFQVNVMGRIMAVASLLGVVWGPRGTCSDSYGL